MKHTKGPWRQGDDLGEIEGQFEGTWIHLANVGGVSWPGLSDKTRRYRAESEANFQLILAVSELLEALELPEIAEFLSKPDHDASEAIKMLEARGDYESGWLYIDEAAKFYQVTAQRARRRAIAKAKGQEVGK